MLFNSSELKKNEIYHIVKNNGYLDDVIQIAIGFAYDYARAFGSM